MQRLALERGEPGLSLQWLQELNAWLDLLDGTKPGMPIDAFHKEPIREALASGGAFKTAIRDFKDDAVLDTSWPKRTLVVDGELFVVVFGRVLDVLLRNMKEGTRVRL